MDAAQALPCKAASQYLGLKQQLAPSRRAALPTLPREQSSDDAAADCLDAYITSMAVVHGGARQRRRLSSVCPARAPTVYSVFIRLGFVEYILSHNYVCSF